MFLSSKITLRVLLGLLAIALLAACESSENTEPESEYSLDAKSVKAQIAETDDLTELMMLGEYAFQNSHFEEAAAYYLKVAQKTQNAEISQRSIELSLKTRDLDSALQTANRWAEFEPDSLDAAQYRMLLFMKKEQYEEAANALHVFSQKKEGFAGFAGIDVAMALLEREANTEQALETLQAYVKLPGYQPKALYYLASLAMRDQQFGLVVDMAIRGKNEIKDEELRQKLALLQVKALTKLDKEKEALVVLNSLVVEAADAQTKQNYARILSSLGQVDQAIELLQEIHAENKRDISVLLDIIGIQLDDKQFADAFKTVDQLSEIPNQQMNAKYFRGLVFEAQEKYSEALAEYQRITGPLRDSMDTRVRIIMTLEKTQGLDKAIAHIDKEIASTQKKEQRKALITMKSHLFRDKERYPEALASIKDALTLAPDDLDVIYDKAVIQERLGDLDAAEKSLLYILEKDPEHSTALNALGYMLVVKTTRFDDAQIYLEKAIALEPTDPAIIDSLGWLYFKQGKLKKAEALIRKAFKEIQDPEVASHLIEILAKTGQKQEAERLLKKMLKEHPDDKLLLEVKSVL